MTSPATCFKRPYSLMLSESPSRVKRENKKSVAEYAESLLISDTLFWKSSLSLQETACSLSQRFNHLQQIEPSAHSLLALSMLYSSKTLSEENLIKCEQLINYALTCLPKRERGKIFKITALIDHEYGPQIRSVLLPKLYHVPEGYIGRSVREILQLAMEYASRLPNASTKILDNILALKNHPKNRQKDLLDEWLQSIQARIDLLDQEEREVLLTRYFISNNCEKQAILDKGISSIDKVNMIYGLSCAIEGLNAKPVECQTSPSIRQRIQCSVKLFFDKPSLITAKNAPLILSSIVVRNFQTLTAQELRFIDHLKLQLKEHVSALIFSYDAMLLEQEFLGNVAFYLWPKHWLKDTSLQPLLETFPSLDALPIKEQTNLPEPTASQPDLSSFDPNIFFDFESLETEN